MYITTEAACALTIDKYVDNNTTTTCL